MQTWPILLLAAVALVVDAAKPDPPDDPTLLGSQKLATASDCSKPVAFSATHVTIVENHIVFSETFLDQGVGFNGSFGTFTTFCPGLYQFSFAGYPAEDGKELVLTLKRKTRKNDKWEALVSTGKRGGSNSVILRMAVGDQVAVFVDFGKPDDNTTFNGYRIAKE